MSNDVGLYLNDIDFMCKASMMIVFYWCPHVFPFSIISTGSDFIKCVPA